MRVCLCVCTCVCVCVCLCLSVCLSVCLCPSLVCHSRSLKKRVVVQTAKQRLTHQRHLRVSSLSLAGPFPQISEPMPHRKRILHLCDDQHPSFPAAHRIALVYLAKRPDRVSKSAPNRLNCMAPTPPFVSFVLCDVLLLSLCCCWCAAVVGIHCCRVGLSIGVKVDEVQGVSMRQHQLWLLSFCLCPQLRTIASL